MSDNTTELDFGTTAQKTTDAEKLPVVLLALDQGKYDMTRSLDELRALADANGMDAVAEVVQKRSTPEAATLLGEGKVAEARLVCQNVNAAAAIFDGELTGSQIRNLSAALQVEVLDRTMLILEIFRARATTNEGKLQTELATLRYQLPPPCRAWASLSRQGGGGRAAAVPAAVFAETKLELDRRHLHHRIEASGRPPERAGKAPRRDPPGTTEKQRAGGSAGRLHKRGQVEFAERPVRRADL